MIPDAHHSSSFKLFLFFSSVSLVLRLLPWLQLDGDALFLSQAAEIGAYHLRQDRGGRHTRNLVAVFSGHRGDVCRFTLTDSHLISGGR